MTCVASYVDPEGNIFMGGDSIGICGGTYCIVRDPKVFIRRNMIFGFVESFRMGDILKYDFQIPDHPKDFSTYQYLTSIFIPTLLERYEERRFLTITDNVAISNVFLLGYDKRIFKIEMDMAIIENSKNYDSAGCGESFAKATFFLLEKSELSPKEKIEKALNVASEFSLVKPPFEILYLSSDSGLNSEKREQKIKKRKNS